MSVYMVLKIVKLKLLSGVVVLVWFGCCFLEVDSKAGRTVKLFQKD